MNKKILFIIIIVGIIFCFSKTRVYADFTLGIYPPILQIDATPPASINSPISIENGSSDIVNLQIILKAFRPSRENNGQLEYAKDSEGIPGNDPLIFQKVQVMDNTDAITSLVLAPQQAKDLTLHIELPKDEPSGDYYFSVLFVSKDQQTNLGSNSIITGGIATNVLLSIGPKDTTTGSLSEFSAPLLINHGPVPLNILVKNTSKHFIVPTGDIIIQNMFGQDIARLSLLPINILSNSERYIPDNKSGSLISAIWPETFLFGPYSARIRILLSDQGPLFERTIYFFAMPIQFIIGIILTMILSTTIFLGVRKRLRAV